MWWSEQAERAAEEERQARFRQKKARRWVDERLHLLPRSYVGAEALLNRAIQRQSD